MRVTRRSFVQSVAVVALFSSGRRKPKPTPTPTPTPTSGLGRTPLGTGRLGA